MKWCSCIACIKAGVDLVGFPGCLLWYDSPTTVSNGTSVFFPGPSLELPHFHSRPGGRTTCNVVG